METEKEALKNIMSDPHKKEVEKEVTAKKSAMKITGKSIMERAEEFKGLNHLLSYKFSDIKPGSCFIPDKEKPSTNTANQNIEKDRIRVAKARARAKIKLLQLLEI
jgi:hypothetical protein